MEILRSAWVYDFDCEQLRHTHTPWEGQGERGGRGGKRGGRSKEERGKRRGAEKERTKGKRKP